MRAVSKEDVRPAAVANLFYPGERDLLEKEIDQLLRTSDVCSSSGEIKAIISPHAGYMYSGRVAATAYKLLASRSYPVVAVISPSHHEYFPGVSVFTGRGYATPLGLVPVAQELADRLVESSDLIRASWAGHRQEHGLEVQLPFLQKVLKNFRMIPIVMGDQRPETCRVLGKSLAMVLEEVEALIIASSDLSHYHAYDEAVQIDQRSCDFVANFDDAGLMNALQEGACEACGGGPMVATMIASKQLGANRSHILRYENSGDVTGDHSRVVGYLSAAFYDVN